MAAALALGVVPVVARAGEPGGTRLPDAPLYDGVALPAVPAEYLVHEVAGLRITYHPSAHARVRPLIEHADEVQAELSGALGASVLDGVEVRVAVSAADLERILPPNAPLHTLALAAQRTLVLSLGTPLELDASDAAAAFRHGLAHLALDEVGTAESHLGAVSGLPGWFQEGWALYFSRQAAGARGRTLWWAMMQQKLVPVADLDAHFAETKLAPSAVPVAEAADFARFLVEDGPHGALADLVAAVRGGSSFDDALATTFGQSRDALEQAWRRDLARYRAFLPVLAFGLLAWALWAGARMLLRWRKERRSPAPLAADLAPKPRRVRVRARAAARAVELARLQAIPSAAAVPKVSYQGRWHTLH